MGGDDGGQGRGTGAATIAVALVAAVLGGLATAGGLAVTGVLDDGGARTAAEVRPVATPSSASQAEAGLDTPARNPAMAERGRTQVARIYDETAPSVVLIEADVTRPDAVAVRPAGGLRRLDRLRVRL